MAPKVIKPLRTEPKLIHRIMPSRRNTLFPVTHLVLKKRPGYFANISKSGTITKKSVPKAKQRKQLLIADRVKKALSLTSAPKSAGKRNLNKNNLLQRRGNGTQCGSTNTDPDGAGPSSRHPDCERPPGKTVKFTDIATKRSQHKR